MKKVTHPTPSILKETTRNKFEIIYAISIYKKPIQIIVIKILKSSRIKFMKRQIYLHSVNRIYFKQFVFSIKRKI